MFFSTLSIILPFTLLSSQDNRESLIQTYDTFKVYTTNFEEMTFLMITA